MTDKLREEITNIIAADESLKFRTEAIEAVVRRECKAAVERAIRGVSKVWP